MTRAGTLVLGLLVATTTTASAHSTQERLADQMYRIELGRQSGAITWREGLKLRKEQREIARLADEFAADGYVSKRERRLINKKQNDALAHIRRESTDGWRRWWVLPRVGR